MQTKPDHGPEVAGTSYKTLKNRSYSEADCNTRLHELMELLKNSAPAQAIVASIGSPDPLVCLTLLEAVQALEDMARNYEALS